MPTYQYACTNGDCGNRFELVQSFTDPAASECPVCGGSVRKVFSAVGVVFKGSGFYRTDSRANGKSSDGAGSAAKESSSAGSASGADSGTSSSGSSGSSDSGSAAKSKDAASSSSGSGTSSKVAAAT